MLIILLNILRHFFQKFGKKIDIKRIIEVVTKSRLELKLVKMASFRELFASYYLLSEINDSYFKVGLHNRGQRGEAQLFEHPSWNSQLAARKTASSRQ